MPLICHARRWRWKVVALSCRESCAKEIVDDSKTDWSCDGNLATTSLQNPPSDETPAQFKYFIGNVMFVRKPSVKIFKVGFCYHFLHNSCVKSKIWKNCFMSRWAVECASLFAVMILLSALNKNDCLSSLSFFIYAYPPLLEKLCIGISHVFFGVSVIWGKYRDANCEMNFGEFPRNLNSHPHLSQWMSKFWNI